MDLTEVEDTKRWQQHTELYKKDLHNPDNHDGVITHLQPDILECEVKWALGSIPTNKASGGDGIPVELFQILKMLCKCCAQCVSKFGKLCSGHRIGKGQFSLQSQRKAMPKKAQTTTQLHSSHMLAKLYSKISKPCFNRMWTVNFQIFNLDLEQAEEPEIKLPTSAGSSKKQESYRKTSTSALLTMPKPLTVWITTNCEKLWKRWEYQTTWPACLLRNLYAGQEPTDRTGHGTTHWFQIGKGVCQGCILLPYLFNLYAEYITRNAGLDEAQAGIKISGRNISITSYMQRTPPLWQKAEKN